MIIFFVFCVFLLPYPPNLRTFPLSQYWTENLGSTMVENFFKFFIQKVVLLNQYQFKEFGDQKRSLVILLKKTDKAYRCKIRSEHGIPEQLNVTKKGLLDMKRKNRKVFNYIFEIFISDII